MNHADNPLNIIAVSPTEAPQAIVDRAGALVLWRLSGTVSCQRFQSLWLLEALDAEHAPEAPSEDVAFSRAIKELTSGSVIASKLPDGGWALVGKTQTQDAAGADLKFGTELRAWLRADDTIRFEPSDDPRAAQVAANFAAFQRELSQQDFSNWLVAQVHRLKAIPLRDTGGVYFVPRSSMPEWQRIVKVVRECSNHKLFNIPAFESDSDTVALILDGITQEAEQLLTALGEVVAEGALGERALRGRKDKLAEFEKKLKTYEKLLGGGLEEVRNKLEMVDEEVTLAMVAAAAAREEKRR